MSTFPPDPPPPLPPLLPPSVPQSVPTAVQPPDPPAPEQRLHPWSWLFVLLVQLRQFLVPLVALLVFGNRGDRDPLVLQLIPVAVIAVLVVISVAQYMTYRYQVGADTITIRSGVLARNRREIPFARIHNVSLHQNILHRVFGVAELRLESAGGRRPEAQMRVLPLAQAGALEQLLRQHTGDEIAPRPADAPPPLPGEAARPEINDGARTLLTLPLGEVLRLGLISNRGLVVIAAVVGTGYQLFPRRAVESFFTQSMEQAYGYASHLHPDRGLMLAAIAGALLVALLLVALSMVMALLRYAGFSLTESGRRLTVESGLLTRLRSSVVRRRIQAWTLREGLLERLLRRRELRVDIAGQADNGQQQQRSLRELAPLATRERCDALLQHLLPGVEWPPIQWHAVEARHWWRVFLPTLVVLPAVAISVALAWKPWALLALLWLPVSAWRAWRQVTFMAFSLDDRRIAVRGGWWSRWWRLAELDKLQALRLTR